MKKILSLILTVLLILSIVPSELVAMAESGVVSVFDVKYDKYYCRYIHRDSYIALKIVGISNVSSIESIPAYLTGYPVEIIGGEPFKNETKIKHIILPDTITEIESYAFWGCKNLKTLKLSKNITKIGLSAFYDCTSLEDLYIADLSKWCEIGFDGLYSNPLVFANNFYLNNNKIETYLNLPENITKIGSYAFSYFDSITSVTIPEEVKSIGYSAFYNCNRLTDVWYMGYKPNKAEISIDSGNTYLTNATWHYSVCEDDNHDFSQNINLTCSVCGFSKAPPAPTLSNKTNNNATLTSVDGCEYSLDGITWQSSNVFTNLSPDTTYTFYQRVKETPTIFGSAASEGLIVTFKTVQTSVPSAPIVSSFTDKTVTLIAVEGCEYSLDGTNWQSSNTFTNLSAVTKYTFYQRYAENDMYEASNQSLGTSITTDKSKQPLMPDAPTVESFTSSSITLTPVNGCEYSKNGTIWQASNVFNNLSCATEYVFYQRYSETTVTYAGKKSRALVAKTDKGTQSSPSAPILLSKTHNIVTLIPIDGYEYSRDSINWQASNIFTGLDPETNYLFYQRKAETDKYYASSLSTMLIVRTEEAPPYDFGDLNGDGKINILDFVRLKKILAGSAESNGAPSDLDNSGGTNAADLIILKKFLLGIIDNLKQSSTIINQ